MPIRTLTIDREALPPEVSLRCLAEPLELRTDCLVRADGSKVVAASADGQALCTIKSSSAGRAAYFAGYGKTPRLLKVLCYYLAGKCSALDHLDTGHPDVLPVYYTTGNRPVVFNFSAQDNTVQLRFAPNLAGFGDAEFIALTPTDGGPKVVVCADTLRSGWKLTLRGRETEYWNVSASSPPDEHD